ncbi:MAG TPA: hypothetical protein VKR06_46365 [Ktedonosporobacter sp.]|nr:hypothetical protein [Ktedonosporobacter sp.]
MTAHQVCSVCNKNVEESNFAPHLQPGDLVICRECDKITPNRWQAQMHYAKRIVQWERLKKIEAAARTAFAHLSWLEKCGDLTREEEPMMNELREALTSKKKEEE